MRGWGVLAMRDDFDEYLAKRRDELGVDEFWRDFVLTLLTCALGVLFAADCLGVVRLLLAP